MTHVIVLRSLKQKTSEGRWRKLSANKGGTTRLYPRPFRDGGFFYCTGNSYTIKTLREDRTAAEENCVAEATRRRRRIPRSSILF